MTVFNVGPSRGQFTRITPVLEAAEPGDRIEVDGDATYVHESIGAFKNGIQLVGLGEGDHRPKIHSCFFDANDAVYQNMASKGTIVVVADGWTIENLDVSRGIPSSDDSNFACIRLDAGFGEDLIVRNCYLHDSQDGFLGGNLGQTASSPYGLRKASTIIIDGCLIERCAWGDQEHNMYLRGLKAIVRNTTSRHSMGVGHLLKSYALDTEVYDCEIGDTEYGLGSYNIDLGGRKATIHRNKLIMGEKNSNPITLVHFYTNRGDLENNFDPCILVVEDNALISRYVVAPQLGCQVRIGTSSKPGREVSATIRNNKMFSAENLGGGFEYNNPHITTYDTAVYGSPSAPAGTVTIIDEGNEKIYPPNPEPDYPQDYAGPRRFMVGYTPPPPPDLHIPADLPEDRYLKAGETRRITTRHGEWDLSHLPSPGYPQAFVWLNPDAPGDAYVRSGYMVSSTIYVVNGEVYTYQGLRGWVMFTGDGIGPGGGKYVENPFLAAQPEPDPAPQPAPEPQPLPDPAPPDQLTRIEGKIDALFELSVPQPDPRVAELEAKIAEIKALADSLKSTPVSLRKLIDAA